MRLIVPSTLAVAMVATPLADARALCIYNGIDHAQTTISQEFRDSRWVVRAKVLSARDHWPNDGEAWTIYQLKVEDAFKGRPKGQLRFFTHRDSGGFYLDLGLTHDLGADYLLFLNPIEPRKGEPAVARAAVFVNYSCGVSKAWREVTAEEEQELMSLSGRR